MPLTARDVMTIDVETVRADDDVGEVLARLARVDFEGFPVVDEDDALVGVVTQGDLVDLFQPSDRTLWIPVGFPPFLESLTYAIDLSWDELDLGVDMFRNADKPVSEVMTRDVVTVPPDADEDRLLELLASEDPDINRLPVVRVGEPGADTDDVGGGDTEPGADGEIVGIVTRQDLIGGFARERGLLD